MNFSWILCGILLGLNFMLVLKILLMKKDLDEVVVEFRNCLNRETNNLITIPTHDYHVKKIAAEINTELKLLRKQRRKYLNGDRELKEAVTNISHDLRTPLTAIYGYLDLLELEDKSEDVKFYIDQIQNRTDAMKQLTEELFRYSVIASTKEENREDVILNKALEESLLAYSGAFAQQHIEPIIEMPDIPIHCQIDLAAFNRIVSNILSNVLKYSDGDLYVKMNENGTILFTNCAKGLTPIMVERLFDRFYTVETGRNSTGLGLSIAKLLTERVGGQIKADYKEGKLTISLRFM